MVLLDEGLAHEVVGRVVEVLGRERGAVDCLKLRVARANDVLLNQLHCEALLPGVDASLSDYSTSVRPTIRMCSARERYARRKKVS
jgi:hypothetical protein